MATTYKYSFNFKNKEEAIEAFHSIPLETLKEYRTMLDEINGVLNDEIALQENQRFDKLQEDALLLLRQMAELNPAAGFELAWGEDRLWLKTEDIVELLSNK